MLHRFREPIEMADVSLGDEYQAYKMDCDKGDDMRTAAGVGKCNCYDYFITQGDAAVLIEETRFIQGYKDLLEKHDDLPEPIRESHVEGLIRTENRLKAYGSLLVLFRLSTVSHEVRLLLQTKKYKFWIVASDARTNQDMLFLDYMEAQLKAELLSVIKLLTVKKEAFQIIPTEEHLKAKLRPPEPQTPH